MQLLLDEAASGPEAEEESAAVERRRLEHFELLLQMNISAGHLVPQDTWTGDAAGGTPAKVVPSTYSEYAPLTRQLLVSARTLALRVMHLGVPPQHLPYSLAKEERAVAATPDSVGVHALWNTSCDPFFRRSVYGDLESDHTITLQVPEGPG